MEVKEVAARAGAGASFPGVGRAGLELSAGGLRRWNARSSDWLGDIGKEPRMSANPLDSTDRRIHPRYPVMWSGELRADSDFDWYVLHCRIRNFSISGVHVLVDRSIEPGGSVVLRIAKVGDFAGQVVGAKATGWALALMRLRIG
jgi:hypothetical protein